MDCNSNHKIHLRIQATIIYYQNNQNYLLSNHFNPKIHFLRLIVKISIQILT